MRNHNYNWVGWALGIGMVSACVAAAAPRLTPLLGGKWPRFTRGNAEDVKVVGNYAYLALGGILAGRTGCTGHQ
jgi:hypothetical protein